MISFFFWHGIVVQLRQAAVLDSAIRSNAIVANLFPSNVRDRIIKEAEEQAESEYKEKKAANRTRKTIKKLAKQEKRHVKKQPKVSVGGNISNLKTLETIPKNQLQDFLNENGERSKTDKSQQEDEYGEGQAGCLSDEPRLGGGAFAGKPIADLFPAATVLFAEYVFFGCVVFFVF